MTKGTMADEISILRFFENGPIEKAEVVFNIVREKMRERLSGHLAGGGESVGLAAPRKRSARQNTEVAESPKA